MKSPEKYKQKETKIKNNISSKSVLIKKNLINLLGGNETNSLFLLLTVLSSYYVNSEKITKSRNLFFIKMLEDINESGYLNGKVFKKKNNDEIDYIIKHIKTYENVFIKMRDIFTENGILKEKESSWKILEILRKKLFNYDGYRQGTVVHGEGARLKKKFKYISEEEKTYFSNFVFPPASYIQQLMSRLDKKLKDKNINVYKKAAYIGTYIFMSHPFDDGNSRSSRIAMVSYLDRLSKNDFRFFTFISNFTKTLSEDSYFNFLRDNVYSEYLKFRDKIKLDDNGNVVKYIPVDEYEKIIETVADKLYKRIIKIYKTILKNKEKSYLFVTLVQEYLKILKTNDKKAQLFRYFLGQAFDSINNDGIEKLGDFIRNFKFSKKFKKKNFQFEDKDYEAFYTYLQNILEIN